MAAERTSREVKGRIWKFGAFELEEIGRTLRKEGQPLEIRGKPLDLLICLLEAKTANVTKDELIKQVWLGYAVEESVIKVTVSTLRKILGDQEQTLILTVFKVGYRMGVPVECLEVDEVVIPRFRLSEGAPVPDKPSWHLKYALDRTTPHWVWAAKQDTNSLVRVFKFAEDGVRYGALQREITLSRLLAKAAPRANCFVKVFDWRLDTSPYYLEAEFGGINLLEWAAKLRDPESGGLPRQLCLQVIAELCDAVDIAHEIGVFHNDLKPSNILLSQPGTDGAWHVKVSDFGIATLLEPQRLVDLDITNHGFGDDPTATSIGSAMYHAPEVKPGQPSTRSADIYAIGVILYQLLSGDFAKTPTPGWQSDIDDVILRQDIEVTVNLNAALRLKSAAELATRLRTLEARTQEQEAFDHRQAEIAEAARRYQTLRAQLPWIWTAVAGLLVGSALSLFFYVSAVKARNRAVAAATHAEKLTKFDQQMFDFVGSYSGPAQTVTALGMIDRTVPLVSAIHDDPATQVDLFNFLGSDYAHLGAYDKADAILNRALKLDEATYGADSVPFAKTLVILSQLRGLQGQGQEAERLAESAYAIDSQKLSAEDRVRLEAEEALAEARSGLEKNEQAIAIEESLIKKIKGEQNLDLLSNALNTLGLAEYNLGRDEEALRANQQSLDIDRKLFGDTNPNVAAHLMTIASIQSKRREYALSIKNYQTAVEINSRWFGPNDPQTADSQVALGETLQLIGKAKEALPMLEAALPVEKRLWKDATPQVARAYNALGLTERDLGKPREARLYLARALSGYRALYPNGSASTAIVLYHLAKMDFEDRFYPAADSEVRESIAMNLSVLGPDNLYTLRSVLLSALIDKAMHHDKDARSAFASVCNNPQAGRAAEERAEACAEFKTVNGGGDP